MSCTALNVLYLWEIAIQRGSWVVMRWSLQFLYSAHTESCRFSMAPDAVSSPAVVPGCTQVCAHKLTLTRTHTCACPTLSMLQRAHFTNSRLVLTWGSEPPQPDSFGSYPEPWVCRRRGCAAFLFGMFCHIRDARGVVTFQFSWGAVSVAVAALCWYPPTGHGSARCFDWEDRKRPVDFVRSVMVGLAMRGSSRKWGSSAKLRPKMQCFRREEASL